MAEARLARSRREIGRNLAAGACCTSLMVGLLNPLDTLRLRWQVAGPTERSLVGLASRIVRQEGLWFGLWSPALGVNMASIFISSGARLGLYPTARDQIVHARGGQAPSAGDMLVGGLLAGSVGFWLSNPLFQAKVRVQAEAGAVGADGIRLTGARAGQPARYRTGLSTVLAIGREEGLTGLFRGSSVLMVRGSLLSGGAQLGYDGTKRLCKQKGWCKEGPALHVLASWVSALLATVFSAPADILMTKYQSGAQFGQEFKTVRGCAVWLVRTEGVSVFYRGFWPFFMRVAPLFMLNMPFYELVRKQVFGLEYMD